MKLMIGLILIGAISLVAFEQQEARTAQQAEVSKLATKEDIAKIPVSWPLTTTKDATITIAQLTPSTRLTFYSDQGKAVLEITREGEIKFLGDVQPSEAAKQFAVWLKTYMGTPACAEKASTPKAQ